MLLDFVAAQLEYLLSHLASSIGNLRLKLHGVLVDTSDVFGIEVDREVVGEKLQFTALSLCGTFGFLGESGGVGCFHS